MVWLMMLTVTIALETAMGAPVPQFIGKTGVAEQQYATEAPCGNSAIKFIGETHACKLGCRLVRPSK